MNRKATILKGEPRKTITIGAKEIRFPYHIYETFELGDKIIVLLDPDIIPEDDLDRGRNVYAFNRQGNLVWQIQDSEITYEGPHG